MVLGSREFLRKGHEWEYPYGGEFLGGGDSGGNEFQRKITRGRKFLKSNHKAKGRSRGKDLTRYGEKGNSQGGTTQGGEFLWMTREEKEIPRDTGLTRVPRLAHYLLCPRSCFSLEFLSRIHCNSYKFNGLVFLRSLRWSNVHIFLV